MKTNLNYKNGITSSRNVNKDLSNPSKRSINFKKEKLKQQNILGNHSRLCQKGGTFNPASFKGGSNGDSKENYADLNANLFTNRFNSKSSNGVYVSDLKNKIEPNLLSSFPINKKGMPKFISNAIRQARGNIIDGAIRGELEYFFDADLKKVRFHTSSLANKSADVMGTKAYSIGNNVFFGTGQYLPSTIDGKKLIAHELSHILDEKTYGESINAKEKENKDFRSKYSFENESYKNENKYIDAATSFFKIGALKKGVGIYKDDYWNSTAIGLSNNSFYVILPSDMGTIKYTYYITGGGKAADHYAIEYSVRILPYTETKKEVIPLFETENYKNFTEVARDRVSDFLYWWFDRSQEALTNFKLSNYDFEGAILMALIFNFAWALAPLTIAVVPAVTISAFTASMASVAPLFFKDPRAEKLDSLTKEIESKLNNKYGELREDSENKIKEFIIMKHNLIEKHNFNLEINGNVEAELWKHFIKVGSPNDLKAIEEEVAKYLVAALKEFMRVRESEFWESPTIQLMP